MAVLDKIQFGLGRKTPGATQGGSSTDNYETPETIQMAAAGDKEAGAGFPGDAALTDKEKGPAPSEGAQLGVRKMEAVTLAWSKKSLATVLMLIWLLTLVNGFKTSIAASLTPFVTSSFRSHSLLTVIGIVAHAMTAAVYIPMAKMLDVWGRAEGFLLMLAFSVLGLILMAASRNLPTYCAAQDVLATDVTNLRNRGLAFAFTSSPNLITAFAGSKAAEAFYYNVSWRWGYGCWAIILPVVAVPIYAMLRHSLLKAEKEGISYREDESHRTRLETIWYCIREFDLLGVILFAGGLTVFLLPFTLAATAPQGWKSGYIIAMIVVGFTALVSFALYEYYVSPVPFLSARFLSDRTVLGACLLDATYQISYYCYASYFTSFLQVVNNLTVSEAGYVANTFSAVSFVFLFLAGYVIRKTGRFRWILFICVPLYIFALGLMIHFRKPNGYIGYIVMCEVFFSVAGSIFILGVQLAVLASVDHQHVAAVLALLFVSGTVGGAVGDTVSGVIWTNTFEKALERYLPETALPDLPIIYQSLPAQLNYPVGSPEWLGIQKAYGYAQARMLAAGTAIMVMGFVWVAMMRDLNVKKMSQTKGTVL